MDKHVARTGASLAIIVALSTSTALAQSRTTYVAWSPNVISIPTAIGAENDISFGPDEQITFASVDDAQRWDAHEAEPIHKDGSTFQRVAITPSERSATNLLVRTSERTYRIRLVAMTTAPSQVAFTYSRAFIARNPASQSPNAAPQLSPAASDPPSATDASSAVTYIPPGTIPNVKQVGDLRPIGFSKCPASSGGAAMRAVKYVTQGVNALSVARAVRNHAVTNAVFGLHSALFYAASLAAENYAIGKVTKNACPRTKTLIDFGMAAAAGFNAAVTPSR